MEIDLVWGVGEGRTALGSFDQALSEANIHNYNLVSLSSVIPEGATVVERGALDPGRWDVGDVLAVVMARQTGTDPGEKVTAGLGWMAAEEGGVFMEHSCGTREECEHELLRNLEDAREIRDWNWTGEPKTKIVEATTEEATSVVTAAVYRPLSLE
ncbi:pyruvoyl-dependent arginine decarboxylase [Natronomonas amylolytica]|uniref:pyruvoyl-dependent arginine decarboxylase n=1 Tax=Natronomonas amylolytica TaxID=3108498 RepID=UPI0030087BF3